MVVLGSVNKQLKYFFGVQKMSDVFFVDYVRMLKMHGMHIGR